MSDDRQGSGTGMALSDVALHDVVVAHVIIEHRKVKARLISKGKKRKGMEGRAAGFALTKLLVVARAEKEEDKVGPS